MRGMSNDDVSWDSSDIPMALNVNYVTGPGPDGKLWAWRPIDGSTEMELSKDGGKTWEPA